VLPSGVERASASMPRLPPAPGRFSMSTGTPSERASGSASARAIPSLTPPGG